MDQLTITKLSKAIKQYWDLVRGRRTQSSTYRGSIWAKRLQIHRMLIDKRERQFARLVAANYAVVQLEDENIELVSSAYSASYPADDVKAVFELQNFIAWALDGATLLDIRADIYQENVDVQTRTVSIFDEEVEVPLVSPFSNVDHSIELRLTNTQGEVTVQAAESGVGKPLYDTDILEWSYEHEQSGASSPIRLSAAVKYVIDTRAMVAGNVKVFCQRVADNVSNSQVTISFEVAYDTATKIEVADNDGDAEHLDFCVTGNEISENNYEWRYGYAPYTQNERSAFCAGDSSLSFPLSLFEAEGDFCLSLRVFAPNKELATRTHICRLLDKVETEEKIEYYFDLDGVGFVHTALKEPAPKETAESVLASMELNVSGRFYREKSRNRVFQLDYVITPPTSDQFAKKELREFHQRNSVVVLRFKNGNTYLVLTKDFLEEFEEVEKPASWL